MKLISVRQRTKAILAKNVTSGDADNPIYRRIGTVKKTIGIGPIIKVDLVEIRPQLIGDFALNQDQIGTHIAACTVAALTNMVNRYRVVMYAHDVIKPFG
ncbi:hypothetical protein [Aeromonas sp. R9-1]|uniref:hypothetical protein n=1 Tax=Aeromonas sp. R9-1 TaxID=3138478 RepID=UPI0034A3E41D